DLNQCLPILSATLCHLSYKDESGLLHARDRKFCVYQEVESGTSAVSTIRSPATSSSSSSVANFRWRSPPVSAFGKTRMTSWFDSAATRDGISYSAAS